MDKAPTYSSATKATFTSNPLSFPGKCWKGDVLASKLEYVSASNPQMRFMISIVSAGVQIVFIVNNNKKLFSSLFGS